MDDESGESMEPMQEEVPLIELGEAELERLVIVYHALPPTKSPTSYHRFGQDLSYK